MFWESFSDICRKNGTTPNGVCNAIGLSNAVATHWKNGTMPKADVLCKIADYLNVSVDYLLGRLPQSMPPETFTEARTESEWTDMLSVLDDDDLLKVKSYVEFLVSQKSDSAKK